MTSTQGKWQSGDGGSITIPNEDSGANYPLNEINTGTIFGFKLTQQGKDYEICIGYCWDSLDIDGSKMFQDLVIYTAYRRDRHYFQPFYFGKDIRNANTKVSLSTIKEIEAYAREQLANGTQLLPIHVEWH